MTRRTRSSCCDRVTTRGSAISPAIARRLLKRMAALPAPSAAEPAPARLSPQERAVLNLSAKGYHYEEIAALMQVSHHTVETYVKRSYRKLQVHSKSAAVAKALRSRLV